MSTYYIHFGETNIKEVISLTNWKVGNKDGEITVEKAIESKYFYITNGKNYLWLITDEIGIIKSFTSYGSNSPYFLIELIGYSVSEYDYDIGLIQDCYDEDEENDFKEWLNNNTYFDELMEVA